MEYIPDNLEILLTKGPRAENVTNFHLSFVLSIFEILVCFSGLRYFGLDYEDQNADCFKKQ